MNKVYYGWFIVAIAVVINTLIIGGVFTSMGVFVLPLATEFELTRAEANTAAILLSFGCAVCSPFVGSLLDRRPLRQMMWTGALLLGGCLIAIGLSDSLYVSAAIVTLPLAVSTIAAGTASVTVLIARWFSVYRSRAMALAALGISFGGVLMPPLLGFLLERIGWRQTLIVEGVVLMVAISVLVLLVRDRPGENDREVPGEHPASERTPASTASEVPMSLLSVLRLPLFWFMCLSVSFVVGAAHAFSITIVPLGQDMGLTAATAAGLLSLFAGGGVCGKLLVASIGQRFDSTLVLVACFALMALANFVFLVADNYTQLRIGCVLLGIAVGATLPVFFSLLASTFGPASFGTVNGLATTGMAIVGAIGVRCAGEIYDRTGGYELLFMVLIGIQFVSMLLIVSARWLMSRGYAPATQPGQV
ncbi:MFS transporter [Pseudomaricurvus sp. HS19]|uniref:MFS transporter n=1 Tax=Pseudomaricurvus sp. HS19 TaxID=2692626 RepID=UPI0013717DF3|nr:MFS transporter [Pseudomaricurvus sp. HS19]MYM61826.1 MFS transporter [Pseudomaricurvus sp. HS19]